MNNKQREQIKTQETEKVTQVMFGEYKLDRVYVCKGTNITMTYITSNENMISHVLIEVMKELGYNNYVIEVYNQAIVGVFMKDTEKSVSSKEVQ